MSRMGRRSLLLAALAAFVSFAVPGDAAAQLREYSGRIVSVSGAVLVVDSGGDKLSFQQAAQAQVSGQKQKWGALAKGDWVTVSWKIGDSPRQAHRVVVSPPRGK
jgi:hypothetical protein